MSCRDRRLHSSPRGDSHCCILLACCVSTVGLHAVAGAADGVRQPYTDVSEALDPTGAWECPCLSSHAEAPAILSAVGLRPTYGLDGCKAYGAEPPLNASAGSAWTGCSG